MRLAKGDAASFSARPIFSRTRQNFFHFLNGDTVPNQVWFASIRIDKITDSHHATPWMIISQR